MIATSGLNKTAARILVIDDDPEMCRFLGELFNDEGYDVELVHDGASALEKYRAAPYDLALTDLMMPRMKRNRTGFEAERDQSRCADPADHRVRHHRKRR